MYNIIADLHTHTNSCGHAYSTIGEMILGAKNKGLYAIAITEHSYTTPGGPGTWFFENLRCIPRMQEGVKVLKGIEANIMDFDGNIDYDPSLNLDFVIASAHLMPKVSLNDATVEKCTQMYLNVAKNPYVNAIGHSGTEMFKYDYERVIPEFKKNHKLVEINAHSSNARAGASENCRQIALLCKKFEAPIIISSDAHYHMNVAEVKSAFEMLEEISFPEELIVNSSIERLEEYLHNHTNMYSKSE